MPPIAGDSYRVVAGQQSCALCRRCFFIVVGRCPSLALDLVGRRTPIRTIILDVGFWIFSRFKFGDGYDPAVTKIRC